MPPGLIVTMGCVAVGISLIVWRRWKGISHRGRISFRELYAQGHLQGTISFHDFSRTMTLIGQAYGFDPEKLRLQDSFAGNLAAVDAVLAGDAPDALWDLLTKAYPSLGASNRFETVLDLVKAVGRQQR